MEITQIFGIVASIISGIVLFVVKREFKKKDDEEKLKIKEKERENILVLRSINAIGKLTHATCIALKDGKVNGELSAALAEYETVDKEMYEYLIEVNSKNHT